MPAPATEFCEPCGKGPMSKFSMSGHLRSKGHLATVGEPESEATVTPSVASTSESTVVMGSIWDGTAEEVAQRIAQEVRPTKGKPAVLDDWLQLPNPRYGGREVKMLRPICRVCEGRWGWWRTCPHDPYVSVSQVSEQVPVYEDMADGRKKQVGYDTIVSWVPKPNRTQTSLSMKMSSGMTVARKKRDAGFIHPSELRSPHFPFGIAEACQFRDCWTQHNLKDYGDGGSVGTYCRKEEAGLVIFVEDTPGQGGLLASGWDKNDMKKRQKQLAEAVASA